LRSLNGIGAKNRPGYVVGGLREGVGRHPFLSFSTKKI